MQIKDKYYKSTESLLYNYNMLKVSIENMKIEIEEVREEDGMTAIEYSTEKTSPTFKITSQTEDTAIKNIEYADLLKRRIELTQNKITRLDNAIEVLPETEKEIIVKYYIEGKEWWKVAGEVHCNERWCRELRKRAINKISVGIYGYTAVIEPTKDSKDII